MNFDHKCIVVEIHYGRYQADSFWQVTYSVIPNYLGDAKERTTIALYENNTLKMKDTEDVRSFLTRRDTLRTTHTVLEGGKFSKKISQDKTFWDLKKYGL